MQVHERLTESAADMNLTIQNRLIPNVLPIRDLKSENFFVSYKLSAKTDWCANWNMMIYFLLLYFNLILEFCENTNSYFFHACTSSSEKYIVTSLVHSDSRSNTFLKRSN